MEAWGWNGIDIFACNIDLDTRDSATGSEAQAETGFGAVLLEDESDWAKLLWWHVPD